MTDRNAQKGNSQNQGKSNLQDDDANRKAGGKQAGKVLVQPVPPGGGDAGPNDQPGDAPGNNRKGGGSGGGDGNEQPRSGSGRSQDSEGSGRSSDGDGMDKDGGRSGREGKNPPDRNGRDANRSGQPGR